MSNYTRGVLAEIDAGVRPKGTLNTIVFDGGVESGALAGKATATTVLTGTNNDMVFTADANGVAGNDISIEYKDPGQGGMAIKTYMKGPKEIVVSLKTSAGVAASTTLTSNNTNVTAGKVVVVGDITYTFKSSMTAAYDVKIGADADTTLVNLAKAINATGVAGTNYFTGTLANPDATATETVTSHHITITASAVGTDGNALATTTDETTLSFTSTVMAGGEDVGQILSLASEVKTSVEASTTAAALVDIANSGADDGSGVVTAMAQTFLAGGSDGKVPLFKVTGGAVCSLRGYCETDLAGASATLVHGVTGTTNMLIASIVATTIDKPKGIDKSLLIARGTALDAVPLWYVQDEDIFATVGTAAVTAGKIHYILDWYGVTEDAAVEPISQ